MEPGGKVSPASARRESTDTVEDFPGGNGGEADALAFDGVQESGDPWLRAWPHHFGDDTRIDQLGKAGSHSLSSLANASGL